VTVFLSPSFCSLPNDRFSTSSKASSPHSTIQCCPVNFQYPLVSLLLSSSCLRRHYRIPVTTKLYIIFSLITCFGRHFLRKKWPMKSAFFPSNFLYCMYVIPLLPDCMSYFFISHTIGSGDLLRPSPAHFKTSQIFMFYFPKCPSFSNIKSHFRNVCK
jgi:hypothetical protein